MKSNMEIPEKTEKKADLIKFHWSKIKIVEGANPRMIFEDIEELADSIAENGVMTPLRGRRDKTDSSVVIISSGERRYRALMLLINRGVDPGYIPFVLEPKDYTEEQRLLGEFLSNNGRNLKPIEEAGLFQRLVNFGFSPSDISRKTGRSVTHVSNLLLLASAPKKIQNQVIDGKITESTVISILKNHSAEEAVEEVNKAILNAEETAELTGKTPKKATVKNVTSEKVKTPIQMLNDLLKEAEGIDTPGASAFVSIMKGLKEKLPLSDLIEILKN